MHDQDERTSQAVSRNDLEQEIAAVMQQDAGDRIIAAAVRSAPLPALEADFAFKLARRVEAAPECAYELYIAAVLFLALGLGGLLYGVSSVSGLNLPLFLTVLTIVTLVHGWDWRDRRNLTSLH